MKIIISREQIFQIIDKGESYGLYKKIYDRLMVVCIFLSLIPMTTRSTGGFMLVLDKVTCVIFIIDYLLRWATVDYRLPDKGKFAFFIYPFTPMAIVDLLSILPSLSLINPAFKVLRISRLFKIFRIIKFVRYYEPLQIMICVIKREGKTLLAVLAFAISYILLCALVMFNMEGLPYFEDFFDAIYWSCCTLTTVGYGDIYPISDVGRAFSMISSIIGIALIALPSGIITSGYMEELRRRKGDKNKDEE